MFLIILLIVLFSITTENLIAADPYYNTPVYTPPYYPHWDTKYLSGVRGIGQNEFYQPDDYVTRASPDLDLSVVDSQIIGEGISSAQEDALRDYQPVYTSPRYLPML